MRLFIVTASLWALVLAKPEMYKESEDFQYSRSSSDEGSKSGFYGAQRGNMGGNYEKAHNMDSMAQHHMSTLVRQVDGELGEGANTNTGSVYTAANSRGIYGSGNYDLSNLKGRNFGENRGFDESQAQSSLYQNSRYQGNSYANNARYGSEQSLSSHQRSGYSSSNLESEFSKNKLESENQYHGASNYDYGALGGSNMRYYSIANSQARGAYDKSNTNLHSIYDLSNQNRLSSATPVKIYIRPGERVALPISAPTYTLYSSNLQDKNVADTTNALSSTGSEISNKPTNNAKHYESAYSYHKKWEKHDTQPLVIPTENPFPANSELYEDRELEHTGQQYQSELGSLNTRLNNVNNGYSAHQNYQSGSANAQSSKSNSAYSSGYAAHTKTASANQERYESENQNKVSSASSKTYSGAHNLESSASNLNDLVEDINSRPKSYHSSFSYHKAWERHGDPYVIIPSGEVHGQPSQKLTATSKNQDQFSSQQYGSQYNQRSYSNTDCDALCHQRKKRSYNINQYQQDLNEEDILLGQQTEDGWDLGQQTENKFENLEDLGQVTQNTWDKFENLGQQTQNQWNNLQNVGQETQSKWDNLGQQTQNNWDHLTDMGQTAQAKWSNQDDVGQQTENQKSELESQNQVGNIEDLGQKSQGEWSNLEDLGQQTQSIWGALGHETQSKWDALGSEALNKMDNLGQETHSEWDSLGQQSQSQWSKLEDLGQQVQTNWGKQQDFGQTHKDLENKTQTQTTDSKNVIINQDDKRIANVDKNETVNHMFLWDTINQMFEEPPKTENKDRMYNNGETLLNHDSKQVFKIEKLHTEKQPQDDQLPQSNKNEQTISTKLNNRNQKPSLMDSSTLSKPKDVLYKQKLENIPPNPFEIFQNQETDMGQLSESRWSNLNHRSEKDWSNLDQQSESHWSNMGQQSESQWSNLNQQSENHWSNLDQQSENHWSNFGQQSNNHWSNFGQLSESQWSNLGQQSENHWSDLVQQNEKHGSNLDQQSENQWSDLGQQSENQWSNLGQQSENHWSDLGHQNENHGSNLPQKSENLGSNLDQQSENQWSNLGQQSENHWSNLGQQSENQWSDLGHQNENHGSNLDQQSENQWSNLGQETQNQWGELSQQTQDVWNHLDKQSPFTGGQQHYFTQDKRFAEDKAKTETEITHNTEGQSHHSQTSKQTQPESEDNEQFYGNNKDLIIRESVHSEKHNVEDLSHDDDITSTKLPSKPTFDLSTTTSRVSTEVEILPGVNRDTSNIGRGDIGADDDIYELGGHIINEHEKPNLLGLNLPSTTMKPINNEHRKPYDYSNILIKPTTDKILIIHKFTPESQKTTTLPSQNVLEETIDQQQQFQQQNIELQETQEDLSVLPVYTDYKTVASPFQNPSIKLGRNLEGVTLEQNNQKHDVTGSKSNDFAEQEIRQEVTNLELAPIKHIEIETPVEPTTVKPGFWSSVWHKTKNAKNTVVSWFKN